MSLWPRPSSLVLTPTEKQTHSARDMIHTGAYAHALHMRTRKASQIGDVCWDSTTNQSLCVLTFAQKWILWQPIATPRHRRPCQCGLVPNVSRLCPHTVRVHSPALWRAEVGCNPCAAAAGWLAPKGTRDSPSPKGEEVRRECCDGRGSGRCLGSKQKLKCMMHAQLIVTTEHTEATLMKRHSLMFALIVQIHACARQRLSACFTQFTQRGHPKHCNARHLRSSDSICGAASALRTFQ